MSGNSPNHSSSSRSTARARPARDGLCRLVGLFTGIVDAGLAAVILVLPFVMGGRQALGQLLLCILAMVTALAWSIAQSLRREPTWRSSRAELIILGGALILFLQLLPWPESVLSAISPQLAESLPIWNDAEASPLGIWPRLSLTPAATQRGIALFASYAVLFLVVVQRVSKREEIERLLKLIALGATCMAAFGLVQYFFGNGKFFWFYEHPQTTTNFVVKGAFTNRNHFAQFLVLGIGPLLWCSLAATRSKRSRRSADDFGFDRSSSVAGRSIVCLSALAVVALAVLLSLSRGGIVAMALAILVASVVYFRGGLLSRGFLLSSIGFVAVVALLLALHGADLLGDRVNQLSSGSLEDLDHNQGRRRVWGAVLRAAIDFPVLGTGVGSHRDVYPKYLNEPIEFDYTHAESSYLQIIEETGCVGAGLVLGGLLTCGWWCWGALRRSKVHSLCGCCGAAMAGLAANFAHATCDCVWYVPGCMCLVVILAACAARLFQLTQPETPAKNIALPRLGFAAVAVMIAGAGIPLVGALIGPAMAESHWHRYAMLTKKPSPTEANIQPVAKDFDIELSNRCAQELQQVLEWSPDHARARLAMATVCLEQFAAAQQRTESNLTVLNLRDAALASKFPSHTDMQQWLTKVVGPNANYLLCALDNARRALREEPFLGPGYLYLSELCFLESPDPKRVDVYLEQAVAVRPMQETVLLASGSQALAENNTDKAALYLRRAFHSGRRQQEWLIDQVAGRVPLSFVVEKLDPDLTAFRMLRHRYDARTSPAEWTEFLQAYVSTAEATARSTSGDPAAKAWLECCQLRRELGDSSGALGAIREAAKCDPSLYQVRFYLAKCLVECNCFTEAREHIDWCLSRKVNDLGLQQMRDRVVKAELNRRQL